MSGPSSMARLLGLGTVFGKAVRDSRLVVLSLALVLGLIVLVTEWAIADQFDTVAARLGLARQMEALPELMRGLIGTPINIETLPGFVSWRLIGFLPLVVGIWSVAALSGTLAGEAARGTLEVILSMPVSRRRLAIQKVAAHAVGVMVAVAIVALITWLGSILLATLPGDTVDLTAALAEFALVGVIALFAGAIAFVVGPLLGRGVAAGIAAGYLFVAYDVNGFANLVPGFDILRLGSVFYWTAGHRPLAGPTDWPAVLIVATGAVVLAAIGVRLFERRDLAATIRLPIGLGRLRALRGGFGRLSIGRWSLAGSARRSLAERLPAAFATGAAMAVYGLFIAAAADALRATLDAVPQMGQMIRQFYPNVDLDSAGGILQLAIFAFVSLVVGLASAALVAGWSGDERAGRLETVLATPLRRTNWALRSGAGVLIAVMVMSLIAVVGPAIGAAAQGEGVLSIMSAGLVLGLYGAALIGIGLAVGGLGRPGWAGPAVAALTIGFYLLDLIGSILNLPDNVLNLSLNRHLGQPMGGYYDVPGLIGLAALALGGLVIGAWAFGRRDLRSA